LYRAAKSTCSEELTAPAWLVEVVLVFSARRVNEMQWASGACSIHGATASTSQGEILHLRNHL